MSDPVEDITHILCCRAEPEMTLCGLTVEIFPDTEDDEVVIDPEIDPCVVCADLRSVKFCPTADDLFCQELEEDDEP